MKASVVDLRYKTKSILECLKRRQKVELTCRGKIAGVIVPAGEKPRRAPMGQDPAIGMWKDRPEPVAEMVARLRQPRFHVD